MARALENTIATVQSPLVGDAPWSPAVDFNAGAAGIYVPSEHAVSDTGVLAEGTLNAAEWVSATIDIARLKHVRESGEMHNFADWARQPGAPAANVVVEVVKLA
jgi:predicted amidohydrolase